MTRSLRARLADAAMSLTTALLPHAMRDWSSAMRAEIAHIGDENAALRFALGCLWCAVRARFAVMLRRVTGAAHRTGSQFMPFAAELSAHPRSLALICASAATCLGLGYMAIADAPFRMLAMNAAALTIGFALLMVLVSAQRRGGLTRGVVSLGLGLGLLATSLFGLTVEGASRWLLIGGIAIQPSLIVVPVMTVVMSRARDPMSVAGLVIAALALALQPDRAMAGALATGLAVVAMFRPERPVLLAHAAAILAFAWTLTQPDALPAMPHVDQIVWTSFSVHPLAGLAVVGGLLLLLVPALAGMLADRTHREAYAVFGAVWLALIVAAMLANYPTPLVGYGASAIIGYVLSIIGLPLRVSAAPVEEGSAVRAGQSDDLSLRMRLA
jgi:hypothetical protein